MDKKIKKLWIAALRSGKFEQVKGRMRKMVKGEYHYCCLGVLEQIRCERTGDKFTNGTGVSSGLLSDVTQKWAGLDTEDPLLEPVKKLTAAKLNDAGKSFKYIADRIEKYL